MALALAHHAHQPKSNFCLQKRSVLWPLSASERRRLGSIAIAVVFLPETRQRAHEAAGGSTRYVRSRVGLPPASQLLRCASERCRCLVESGWNASPMRSRKDAISSAGKEGITPSPGRLLVIRGASRLVLIQVHRNTISGVAKTTPADSTSYLTTSPLELARPG
jgi:hypothetical protein